MRCFSSCRLDRILPTMQRILVNVPGLPPLPATPISSGRTASCIQSLQRDASLCVECPPLPRYLQSTDAHLDDCSPNRSLDLSVMVFLSLKNTNKPRRYSCAPFVASRSQVSTVARFNHSMDLGGGAIPLSSLVVSRGLSECLESLGPRSLRGRQQHQAVN